MKLSILQENLIKGLTIVSRSIATRAQLPILNHLLLTTDKGRLKLSATNLETGINYWLGAKIEKEGAISVPAKILTEFVSSLPPEKIILEIKDNNFSLNCGSYQANFVGLPAGEFPSVPTSKNEESFSFNSKDLINSISQVAFAAAQDESRLVLTGVLLVIKERNLVFVATDGFRLSFKKIQIKGIEKIKELEKGLVIPARTLTEVGRLIAGQEQEKTVRLIITSSVNQVIFATQEAEIISRLIEGSFPEFEKIIPEKGITKIIIEKEQLMRSVRMAAIFARESANIVKWEITDNKLKVSANAAQVGENISEIEVKTEGEENKIAFNSRYLLDFLNSVNSEQVCFEMTTPLNPGVFRPVGDDSYLHIIMPVRVQE